MVDTPLVYFGINHLDAVGGVMVTASHNPVQYNGFKISGPKAKPIGAASGLDDIKRIVTTLRVGFTGVKGKVTEVDLWDEYRAHVLKFLELKRPIKVVVDASNGMAGKMIPKIFGDVPNLEIVPLLFDDDRQLRSRPEPAGGIQSRPAQGQNRPDPARLGVCIDGDGDRCVFVDETGKMIGCDLITALLARDFLDKPENQGATVVYDLRSSHVVADEVAAPAANPNANASGMPSSKRRWPKPRPSSAANCPATSTFATTFMPTVGRSPSLACYRSYRARPVR